MRNKKWIKGIAVALCIASITGCGTTNLLETDKGNTSAVEQNPQTVNESEHAQQENADTSSQEESCQSGNINELLNTATSTGNVTDFTGDYKR